MINILIIEDDPMVAEINKTFVNRVEGYRIIGTAGNYQEALTILNNNVVDLILLDVHLPGKSGLSLLKEIRNKSRLIDVIVISAAKDTNSIKEALSYGAVDYIVKPFTFERLSIALQNYMEKTFAMKKETLSQTDIDSFIIHMKQIKDFELPKGIDQNTLKTVYEYISNTSKAFSVQEISEFVNISRVSIKKYLDFLCDLKVLKQTYIYGKRGRPLNKYSYVPEADHEIMELLKLKKNS